MKFSLKQIAEDIKDPKYKRVAAFSKDVSDCEDSQIEAIKQAFDLKDQAQRRISVDNNPVSAQKQVEIFKSSDEAVTLEIASDPSTDTTVCTLYFKN